MKQELIRDFNLRISNANRSQLVVIKFDIFDVYAEDAKAALSAGNGPDFKLQINSALSVLGSFEESLDFKYDISVELYNAYQFCIKQLYKALSLRKIEYLDNARYVMRELREAFVKVAELDDSPVIMQNSEQVTAGMTYGKGVLYEGSLNTESNRGFWA